MLQERIEARWLAAFNRVFALNGIGTGTRIAILSGTRSRPVLLHLCELAPHDLGGASFHIQMPTPPQTGPVPVKSTGTNWAIQGNRAVVEALKLVEVVVDCAVEGLIHAPEWPEIEAAGNSRLLVIPNEHPEVAAALARINAMGPALAARAKALDDEAAFPTANYRDLADAGFLGLTIPQEFGGWGSTMGECAIAGAKIGKYCEATAQTFNMRTSSKAWSRFMYEMPNLTAAERAAVASLYEKQFHRVMTERAIYSRPISEGGQNWISKPNQTQFRRVDGGWRITGF